jgi:hypothetical protein
MRYHRYGLIPVFMVIRRSLSAHGNASYNLSFSKLFRPLEQENRHSEGVVWRLENLLVWSQFLCWFCALFIENSAEGWYIA